MSQKAKVWSYEAEGLLFEIVTVEHIGLLFKIVIVELKGLPSKIVIVEHKWLGIIFFLLVILNLRKLILNCRKNSGKRMVMTWQLLWLNLSVATLNATIQLLVIHIQIQITKNLNCYQASPIRYNVGVTIFFSFFLVHPIQTNSFLSQ